jgi:chaperonin GroES
MIDNPRKSDSTFLKPLYDRVLVKRIEKDAMTSGIVIPDTAKEKSQEGQVVAIGTGRLIENGTVVPLGVKEGDRILFGKFAGTEIRHEDQDYVILREDEIFGILAISGKTASSRW